MHCTKTRTMCRMLCNFWFGMLGGLIVYSFIFLLDLAWFNWINYFPCIWLPSLPIESHQEWYFLLDHLTILHYFTCTDAVRAANVLSLVGVFLCVPAIYTCFLTLLLKHLIGNLVPKSIWRNTLLLQVVWKGQRIRIFLI